MVSCSSVPGNFSKNSADTREMGAPVSTQTLMKSPRKEDTKTWCLALVAAQRDRRVSSVGPSESEWTDWTLATEVVILGWRRVGGSVWVTLLFILSIRISVFSK